MREHFRLCPLYNSLKSVQFLSSQVLKQKRLIKYVLNISPSVDGSVPE